MWKPKKIVKETPKPEPKQKDNSMVNKDQFDSAIDVIRRATLNGQVRKPEYMYKLKAIFVPKDNGGIFSPFGIPMSGGMGLEEIAFFTPDTVLTEKKQKLEEEVKDLQDQINSKASVLAKTAEELGKLNKE